MRYALIAIGVIGIAAAILFIMPDRAHTLPQGPSVTVGGTTYAVEVADTPATQELGLGQRDSLPAGRGMLFVFDRPGNWGFWMKDTRFALDMVWARQDGTVISVARNVATSTYPQVFYPTTPDASYVLEVNAGAAGGVMPGDIMTIRR